MINPIISIIKKERKIIGNSSYMLLANIIGSTISLVANFSLSLILGPIGLGSFKTISSFFEGVPVSLGTDTTLTKYIPELEAKKELGKIKHLLKSFYLVRIGTVFVFVIIFYILREELAFKLLKDTSNIKVIYAGIVLFIISSLDLIRLCVLGFRNYTLYINTNLLISVLRNIFALICACLWGIPAAILALGLSLILGLMPSINFLRKRELFSVQSVPINVWQVMKNYSLPVYFAGLTGLVGSLNIPLLALFYSQKTIGYYSFALMIGSLVALVSGALGQIFFPEVVLEHSRNGAQASLKKLTRILAIFITASLIIIPAGIAVSAPLVHHFAGTYTPAIPIITPLLFIYSFIGALSLITAYCTAIGKNKMAAILNLLSSIFLFTTSFMILRLI
ncbi:oligosaccharide flippase family protein [Patescibacteria group bacterium]|nr:oligosaccharide flippase family protein [Patescibacteria group bacterium]